jgi:hypothetical protein
MTLAIMQPYIFPYIGYFQLMNRADEFVIYDNIEFTKKGWINRNRILVNGKDEYISFPLKKASDFLQIKERCLADNWNHERRKLLNKIAESYRKSPNFETIFPLVEKIVLFGENNLFGFIQNSLIVIKAYLGIKSFLTISSSIPIDHTLKAENKVIEICKARKATTYINPIGGIKLYSKDIFKKEGIDLQFLRSADISYAQFQHEFVPSLSIIDVMMFNSKERLNGFLNEYILD